MNFEERQAAVKRGGVHHEFLDYADLVRLIVLFGAGAFMLWLFLSEKEIQILATLASFVISAIFFAAICLFWQTGRLTVICEELIPMQKVRQELEEIGYDTISIDEFHIDLTRRLSRFGPTVNARIFADDGKILGYAWMTGGRFNRMPWVTGRSRIRAIRRKLLVATAIIRPSQEASAATQSPHQIDLPSRRERTWKNRR